MIDLRNSNLDALPEGVRVPTYDRSSLTPGIVHIGLGNFHRAHQSWYLHRLFEAGLNHDWAIIGAGVRPEDATMREKLAAQDFLTTLIELDPKGSSAEVVGSMIGYVPYDPENRPLIAQIAKPEIRIVSLTVTEGGYFIDPATGGFDASDPQICHDAEDPETPATAFGAIVAALKQRRSAGTGPLTLQCCDNLQANGDVLRQTVVSLARLSDGDLADWIEAECTFPNAMVDCIVPATGPKELALAEEFGIADQAPVTHENFRQWVIEEKFCAGRPEWEKVGATITGDVHDFERMKIRMLNGGHQVIADLGELLSIETISGTMEHAGIRAVFEKVEREEIMPHVKPVPGYTPAEYLELLISRFGNPMIVDTTRRVAFDGSSRHPGFLLGSVRDGLAAGTATDGLAFISAAWARYCAGTRPDGSTIAPNDPFWSELQPRALKAKEDPGVWLAMQQTYGELAEVPAFSDAFSRWLQMIWNEGVEAAMDTYLGRR
ncbi:mannitol dehydrogenase family protein [Tropicimonas marinistellae]|uniref:mannitol dehydrogenase family protein n=1 Tax=Tropicimonas marinistellae TaxID=1739787 RepID=UPI0008349D0E|nr:mannitol dehydrogenase family protein [Tropicimonas marinistellae]